MMPGYTQGPRMLQKFYDTFIKPTSIESDSAERELVLNCLLFGIFALSLVALADTLLELIFYRNRYLATSILGISLTIVSVLVLYALSRYTKLHTTVSLILVIITVFVSSFL